VRAIRMPVLLSRGQVANGTDRELLVGRRRFGEHPVQHEGVKMDVGVQRAPCALQRRDHAGRPPSMPRARAPRP